MKRDELIEELKKLPKDAEIRIEAGCGCCAYSEYDLELTQSDLYPGTFTLH